MNSVSTIILYDGNILSFSIETAYIGIIMLHAHDAKQHHSVNIYFTLTCKYILAVSICGLFHESRLVISAAVDFFGGKALDDVVNLWSISFKNQIYTNFYYQQ